MLLVSFFKPANPKNMYPSKKKQNSVSPRCKVSSVQPSVNLQNPLRFLYRVRCHMSLSGRATLAVQPAFACWCNRQGTRNDPYKPANWWFPLRECPGCLFASCTPAVPWCIPVFTGFRSCQCGILSIHTHALQESSVHTLLRAWSKPTRSRDL